MSATSFVATRNIPIRSLNLVFEEYRHAGTGARHFHLATDDTNNAFLVAFLTVPQDSKGVAHILEHTSLCGSSRFPVRDPFFMMIRRSLNTFMNAFTASDWTAYPFASQNRKDFDNLLEVYLDAAFFPLLDPLDFAQEGHRIEFSVPGDTDSSLEYKGVVYNEMKGAMSSPVSQVAQILQSKLFPTITYHHNSGGDPAAIPSLSHAELKSFHKRHYHPSNAVFMTYGSFSPQDHQERIESLVLRHFESQDMNLRIGDEQRFSSPREEHAAYATDETELARKSHVLLGWVLGNSTDVHASMRARLLAGVLLDNSASPLRHALETTALGIAPSELCGLDDSTREATFVCGLEGCEDADAAAIESLVLNTLTKLATDGVDQSVIDSVVHQVELAQREVSGGGFPYGLQLMVRSLSPALYGGDPCAALDIDPVLETLREEVKDPSYVPTLIRELLLDNPHRVRLTMAPDSTLVEQRQRAELARLEQARESLDDAARVALVEQADALRVRQESEDDPELLPKVTIEDVPNELAIPEPQRVVSDPVHTTLYTSGTNGLVYVQLIADLPRLDAETLPLLPIFCDFLADVGCGERDYLQTQEWQAAVTGGVRARSSVRSAVDSLAQPKGYFVLAGKALARNADGLVELLRETFLGARFDELNRLRELVAQARLHAEAQVTDSGHSLAMLAATAGMSACAWLEHTWGGLDGLQTLKQLDQRVDSPQELAAFGATLARLRDQLRASACEVLLVSEPDNAQALHRSLAEQWSDLGDSSSRKAPTGDGLNALSEGFTPEFPRFVSEAWTTNTQVNFCAQAFAAPPQSHPDAPALRVLGGFLRNSYLHRAVREQGGAYGSGAGYSPDSGSFRFYSYRDPRLSGTLQDFGGSVQWLLDNQHPARLLEEALLGVVGEIDRPDSPAGEAVIGFFGALHGRTPKERREFRQAVLDVSMVDLRRVSETYLGNQTASTAVVTSTAALADEPALAAFTRHHI